MHGFGKPGEVPGCTNLARDIHERAMQAYEQNQKMGFSWIPLIDRMDNAVNRMYGVPPAVHCVVDIDGRVVAHRSGKQPFPEDILEKLASNGGRLPGARPRPLASEAGYPPGWYTHTDSKPEALHRLLVFYHKQERWQDALQLLGQHRHHLDGRHAALLGDALRMMRHAAETDTADAAWIRLLCAHIRERLQTPVPADLERLLHAAEALTLPSR